ncbi:MAG: FTR1 family protein [Streptosporangiaceae bacterium]|nr:FTR1 family protein [Streptosporangiaceae bacterium]
MLATLVIFLREGVEASMIVAILLAYLNRIGQRKHFRDVFVGVGAALVLAAAGGAAAYLTIRSYDGSRVQTIFETVTFLVAAAVLTYMTFWMRSHARSLSSELRDRAQAALDGRARWGLGLLAFQAVGREGLETVVFTLAIIFSTSTAGALSGAAIGLAGALGIAFVIYRLGHRLNLGRFFTVIGVLLMVFAAGLLADAVQNLQQLGWLPVLNAPMWHSAALLSQGSAFGDVLHSFFGYSDAPTPLQLLVYVAYLAVVIAAYLGVRSRARTRTA